MSERQAANSAVFSLDPAAAGRVLSAIDALETPRPDQPANTNISLSVPPGYIIDRIVGTGGGGTVYRAFREGSDRPLALKILEPHLGEGPAAQRAWRELQLLEDLHLPILPRVIDHGVHLGRLYIATEFVEGHTLDDFASTPPPPSTASSGMGVPPVSTPSPSFPPQASLPQAQLVSLLAKVADAVQLLHEHGVIHRDLKPSNIIIDQHHQPIIIDLGIASMLAESAASAGQVFSTLTEDGRPIGTPAYMAPEQARGERHRISTRSDVFSLGATAYKLLTGTTPHDTNTTIHEAIRRVAFDEPRDPRTLEPTLPKPLAAVLSKACSREPARRYASAVEFGTDLRRWANGEAVEAVPPGAWQRAVRWAGRRPVVVTVAACVLMLAGTLALTRLSVWWYDQLPKAVTRYPDAREYRLVTRSGNTLKTWADNSAPSSEELFVAKRVDIPASLGGGWVVVAVDPNADEPVVGPRQLAVWNPNSLGAPMWNTKPTDLNPPAGSEQNYSEYRISSVILADVFPNPPGEEIVAIHTRDVSPSAIRIYSLTTGEVLFEAWHRGHIRSLYWTGQPSLLVLVGLDNSHSWRHPILSLSSTAPHAVFAIRPIRGGRYALLNTDSSDPHVGEVLAWYRYPCPPEFILTEELMVKVTGSSSTASEQSSALVALEHPKLQIGISLEIDAAGNVRARSELGRWSERFKAVPPDRFRFCDDLPREPLETGAESAGPR